MILQDIKRKFRLVDADEDWKDYRQLLTGMVIDAGGGDKIKTVTVIGAGYCNDIDIISLCRNYKAVTLFDCDIEALTKVKNITSKVGFRIRRSKKDKTHSGIPYRYR